MQASFEVEGMSIKGGILWMGWPTDIGKTLDGLKGIESHSFKIENRKFTVRYNSEVIDQRIIIQAVEGAGGFTVNNWVIVNWIIFDIIFSYPYNFSIIKNRPIMRRFLF